jgi:cytochrome c oxidase subunit I+III
MFTVGIPHLALSFFSAASGLVAIPTAVQIFAWIATIAHGRPRFDVPMLYLGGFFVVFVLGGLTGVMLAMVPFNFQAHDTHFVVAHLHYVLVGGFVFPMLAAAYYWLPHFTGRVMAHHRLSVPAFWLIFGGFNLTFFLMHLTGLLGMPRRVATYPRKRWDWLNLVSSIGGFVMTIGFALFVLDVVVQLRFGRASGRNPWKARTLEWATPTPPPAYAFASLPHIGDRADRLDPNRLASELARGDGYLGKARNGWQETLGVDMVSARPTEIVVLPRPTFLPLWTGLATGAVVICLLAKAYWLALVPFAVVIALFLKWTGTTGSREDMPLLEIGRGHAADVHWQVERPPSWWGMAFALTADTVFLSSLLFGAVFLLVVAPQWPPQMPASVPLAYLVIAAVAGFGAAAGGRWALARLQSRGVAEPGLGATLACHAVAFVALAACMSEIGDPTRHAQAATIFMLLLFAAAHAAMGALLAGYGLWRSRTGMLSARRSLDLRIGRLWHDFTAIAVLASAATVGLLQAATGAMGAP